MTITIIFWIINKMTSEHRQPDMMLKILLLGDSGCGKTCVLLRYCNDAFSSSILTSIGIDFKIKTIEHLNKLVKLQIWDTAGQERFRTITASYYRGSNAVMIVYDITDRTTFQNVAYWIKQITKSNANVTKILVGNKSDCKDQRVISYEEGLELSKKYCMPFFETSAKTGDNVDAVFLKLIGDTVSQENKKYNSGIPGVTIKQSYPDKRKCC